MLTLYTFPPILNPFLYCGVAWIVLTIQLSAVPKSARAPVSGWMKPIRMSWVPAPAVAEEDEDEEVAPLMLELHASSSPPPPTTAALAPAARNRPRRLKPPGSVGRGENPPEPPCCFPRGDPSPRTPLGRDPSPQAPLAPGVLSGCAVWSLMCNRSPFEVAPRAR